MKRCWKLSLSLLFGLGVFFVWWLIYPGHLAYQEQYQLFLFDAAYWQERVAVPGGWTDYLAEYLTQFYYHPSAGAAILAVTYLLLQRLLWRLARRWEAPDVCYPLTFLPLFCLWGYMGDENVMLSFPLSLLLTMLAAYGCTGLKPAVWRRSVTLLLVPLLYWVAGPSSFLFGGWMGWHEGRLLYKNRRHDAGVGAGTGRSSSSSRTVFLCWLAAVLALAAATVAVVSGFAHYPFLRLLTGINYYRFPAFLPMMQLVTALLFLLFPPLLSLLPPLRRRVPHVVVALALLAALPGGWWVRHGLDLPKEEAMTYDRLLRFRQWERILDKARRKPPVSPFAVTCLNLALGKTGQLAERMFFYYQNGVEGLLPDFRRDFTSPLPTGEAYYHLGMVNTAQRYAFEAMEAIPNYRKSGRCIKRLAETNLINGQYAVAAKYLRMLQKSLFYRAWADRTMEYLYDEEKIASHPEWGWLRQARYDEDFLFSEREVEAMLGRLYVHDRRNRLAFEYMQAYILLQRDVNKFMRYYSLGKDAGYQHIPRSYQEVLVFVWTQSHKDFRDMPWNISPAVMQDVTEFARLYLKHDEESLRILRDRFGYTYWYYLLLKGKK